MTRALAIILAVCAISIISPNVIAKENIEAFEIQTKNIDCISTCSEKGTITLEIQDISYLYYLPEEKGCNKNIATSALLNDIQKADIIQIQYISAGINRQIKNIILFNGKHVIPESLKNIPKREK